MPNLEELPESNRDLKNKVVQGGAWSLGRMLITNVLNLGVMAILARELSPAEFGLVALASVIIHILTLLGTEGINQFIIHDHGTDWKERTHAAFWLDGFMSLAISLIGILLIPAITRFYTNPGLREILIVLIVVFPVRSLSKVPDAILRKNFEFKKLEIRDTILEIFIGVTSVTMALLGYGVWSLVIPGTISSALRLLIVFKITSWRPEMHLYTNYWSKIFKYYANIMGNALTSLIITDGDTLLIGKLLGNKMLGIYNMGWQSANIINRTITGIGNKLALPALSRVSNSLKQSKEVLYKILKVSSTISFPAFVGLFVIADNFILVVYGSQWEASILPFRILLVFAMRYAINPPLGAYFQSIGRPDVTFKLGLVIVPFYLLGIWIGSFYGIVGVAVGVTIVRTVFGFVTFELVARFLKVRFFDILKPLTPAFYASIIMGVFVFGIKMLLSLFLADNQLIMLLILVISGILTYWLLLRNFFKANALDLTETLKPLTGKYHSIAEKLLKTTAN